MDKVLTFVDAEGKIMPLINFPHNDVENGQPEVHYHADLRYCGDYDPEFYSNDLRINLPLKEGERLEWREMKMVAPDTQYISPLNLIANSKFKHKCIHKGKCPHRGYDLSKVESKEGRIVCPMHGLEFNAEDGKLVERIETYFALVRAMQLIKL